MANITTQTIRVDLSTDKVIPSAFTHQNDTARTLVFDMYNGGMPYTMTGNTVKFAYKSPIVNGQYSVIAGASMASGTVDGNKVSVTLPVEYTQISGVSMLTMIITPTSGTVRPVNIRLVVQRSADGANEIAGASDFPTTLEEIADNWYDENIADWLNENIETIFDAEAFGTAIDTWLDDHPEATTTVQDGSIAEAKLSEALKLKTVNDYVTPEMFGAACDGVTDDSTSFKNCILYAQQHGIRIHINNNMLIDEQINIPSDVTICGTRNNGSWPSILIGDNVQTVLNLTGVRNVLLNFGIRPADNTYHSGVIGVKVNGNSNGDADPIIKDLIFYLIETGIKTTGRNTYVEACDFSHCKIGVDFTDLPTSARGMIVDSCRFHGIGEEADLNWFEDSYAIKVLNNTGSNVVVRNNIFEQGGCCLYGYASNLLFAGNLIESYKDIPIQIVSEESQSGLNNGVIQIESNIIRGKSGQVSESVTVTYPDHLILIDKFARINIVGNSFSLSNYEAIYCKDTSYINVNSNSTQAHGLAESARNALIRVKTVLRLTLNDNVAVGTGAALLVAENSGNTLELGNNSNYTIPDSTAYDVQDYTGWKLVGSIKSQTAISISLPKDFLVTYGNVTFHCQKYGTHISHGIYWDSATTFFVLSWTISGSTITPYLRKYDVTNLSSPSGYASTMDVLIIVNK